MFAYKDTLTYFPSYLNAECCPAVEQKPFPPLQGNSNQLFSLQTSKFKNVFFQNSTTVYVNSIVSFLWNKNIFCAFSTEVSLNILMLFFCKPNYAFVQSSSSHEMPLLADQQSQWPLQNSVCPEETQLLQQLQETSELMNRQGIWEYIMDV